jgi:threonine dehydrogenase-like Zn-dependent dehydrogenase
MKAIAVERGDAEPTVLELERPTPLSGEALVRTIRVGIDGTDHEVIRGGHGGFPDGSEYMVLGHEAVGVVEDANDTDFEEGDIVVPTVRRPAGSSSEYFERGEPDMAPSGEYVERGIVGAHGFMAEYFTSPEEFLVEIPRKLVPHGYLIEPISNSEKAFELAAAARSSFHWVPESALVLGNGNLGLLTVAMLYQDSRYERVYCLGRRDRPDPTIDIIERLDATYVDSRSTPLAAVPETYESMDFVYEATGFAEHAFETIAALAPNGVGVLLGIPDEWQFEIDAGALHREFVLENKALLGSVNSHVPHFEAAARTFESFPDWFVDEFVTGVYRPEDVTEAFDPDDHIIKQVIEFSTP